METKISKSRAIWTYFLICIPCVFLSGHSYSIVVSNIVDVVMLVLGFVVCARQCPRVWIPRRINADGVFAICIATGAILSYIIYRNYNMWLDPLLVLGRIGLAYFISQRISLKNYARIYSNVMAFFSAIAICIYFLNTAGFPVPSYTYMGLDGRMAYHTVWLCTWGDYSKLGMSDRIMGPFWEPGLYSSMAIYALLCEGCFTGQKPRKLPIAIILVGIFLSNSTAGYILTLLAMYIVFFKSPQKRILFDIVTLFLMLILFFFSDRIIETLLRWNPTVFWKLAEQSITADTRLYSPVASFLVFMQNPITGLGMSYATEQYNLYKAVFGIDSLTSTSAFMLAAFGIWGIAYTVFLCRGVWRQKQFGFTVRILMVAIFLMIVNKEPHTSILFTYIMFFYLNKEINERETFIINE